MWKCRRGILIGKVHGVSSGGKSCYQYGKHIDEDKLTSASSTVFPAFPGCEKSWGNGYTYLHTSESTCASALLEILHEGVVERLI